MTETVEVCPLCDIADCRHIRERRREVAAARDGMPVQIFAWPWKDGIGGGQWSSDPSIPSAAWSAAWSIVGYTRTALFEALQAERDAAIGRAERAEAERDHAIVSAIAAQKSAKDISTADFFALMALRKRVSDLEAQVEQLKDFDR